MAVADPSVPAPVPAHAPAAGPQLLALGRRSFLRFMRQPALWMPAMVFPLLLASVNSAAFARIEDLGVFPPGTSFLQFLLPAIIVQGVLFGGINGGSELATDIQTGFLDRLLTSPVSRSAILLGRIGGSVLFAVMQSVLFLAVLWPFGAEVRGGVAGALVIVLSALLLAIAVGGFGAGLAARTGQPEAVQGFFPIIFILLFLSSSYFPTELMSGWFKTVAERNPLTFLVDGMRHQVVVGFDLGEAAVSLGLGALAAAGAMVFAVRQMRHRWEAA